MSRLFLASKVAETGPQLYQVASQLSKVSSSKLRVKVATGGDPSFPLRVNLRGEQVLGLGKYEIYLASLVQEHWTTKERKLLEF